MLFLTGTVFAAEPAPREQVLNLVPPDASVCFVVQNLRDQAKTVAGSQFAKWATARIGAKLEDNDDAKRLKAIEAFFMPILGVSLTDLRDDILGDCIAFAYEPGPPGQPNAERGVMILYAKDPAKLQKLVAKLNEYQKGADELKELKEHTYAGVKYTERVRASGVSEYYLVRGNLFAFATQDGSIKGILDRQAKPQPGTVLKDLDDLKLQNAFWACWLSPRKLDADLKAAGAANTPEAAGLAQMAKLWGAVDRCAFYLRADSNLELGVAVTYRADALPKEVRSQFSTAPVASPLWNSIPSDAILALAGEAEANALIELIGSFLPAADRPKLKEQIEKEIGAVVGKAKVPAILAALGPDFGLWAVKTATGGEPLPLITAALRVKSEPDASVPATLMKAIGFCVLAIAVDYNRNHQDQMDVNDEAIGGVNAKVVANDKFFPNGVKPAFAIKEGYFVVGSSPKALTNFNAPTLAPTNGDVPLARLSASALRDHLATHRDSLAKFIASLNGHDEDEIRKNLDTLRMVLEAMDSAEVVIRGDGKSRTFAVKVKLVKPLK